VLPTWAAVTIALGGPFIGAAGALLGAFWQSRRDGRSRQDRLATRSPGRRPWLQSVEGALALVPADELPVTRELVRYRVGCEPLGFHHDFHPWCPEIFSRAADQFLIA